MKKRNSFIFKQRIKLGLTQKELAKIMVVTDRTVRRWERETSPTPQLVIEKLHDLLTPKEK